MRGVISEFFGDPDELYFGQSVNKAVTKTVLVVKYVNDVWAVDNKDDDDRLLG